MEVQIEQAQDMTKRIEEQLQKEETRMQDERFAKTIRSSLPLRAQKRTKTRANRQLSFRRSSVVRRKSTDQVNDLPPVVLETMTAVPKPLAHLSRMGAVVAHVSHAP